MDIKDRNLFIGEVINKYKSKVELFDKELSPDERVQFFEYKQEFMMFINWLEKEAQAPYKKAKKGKQPTTTNIKNLSNYIQTSKDRKGSCLNECIGILKDMKVINDASIYIPGTKVNKFAYWIHALNEFCIINIKEIGNKQSVVDLLRAEFPGLKMSASTMQKSKWEGAFSKDDDDGYKQEIRTIATAYACIKYGK